MIDQFLADPSAMPHYTVQDQLLFWKQRLVLPSDSHALIDKILFEFHSSHVGGHVGFLRTFHRIAAKLFEVLKANLTKAQARMKRFADLKLTEMEFTVDDWVFVSLQPYRQHSVYLKKNEKLSLLYFGPFRVIQSIGSVAYKLLLPPEARTHLVFHVSLLKKCVGSPADQYVPLPLLDSDDHLIISPLKVLDVRQVKIQDNWESQVLVRWRELSEDFSPVASFSYVFSLFYISFFESISLIFLGSMTYVTKFHQ
ncbi:Transposon Ty3-I Gag-Pol polyprotein [Sesbania bispinosa]|nr:Transposon Ty3-I Gag-Pol polyprotein [Sesbania bispinosa]